MRWQEGVAHPHAMAFLLCEDKNHPRIGRHAATMHQSLHAIFLRGSHLSLDAVEAGGQFHARHRRLRVRGGDQRNDQANG